MFDKNLLNKVYSQLQKEGYVPPAPMPPPMDPAAMGGAPPMDPAAMGMAMDPAAMGGAPPMDPAAMGAAPPMDPAAMGAAPPMDPAAMGMAMDPAAMGGAPPMDPAAMGEVPPEEMAGEQPVTLTMDDLKAILEEAKGGSGGNIEKRLNAIEMALNNISKGLGVPLSTPSPEENLEEEQGGEAPMEEEPLEEGFNEEVNKTASEDGPSNRDLWHRSLESKRDPVLAILKYMNKKD